jgi:hypothetical protein
MVTMLFILYNGSWLCEGADFITTFDTKHEYQIYEEVSYEVFNPLSCKTLVMPRSSFRLFDLSVV